MPRSHVIGIRKIVSGQAARLTSRTSLQSGSKPHSAFHKTSLSLNPNAKALTYKIYLYIFMVSPRVIYVVSD